MESMNNNQTCLHQPNNMQQWYLIDAKEQTLGRISTVIAQILRGKHNIDYTPNIKHQNYIIVINSKEVKVTGQKKYQKLYKRHSGRPGSMKTENFNELQERIPNRIVEKAVKGMLPKGKLGRALFKQIKVYETASHPHNSQQPQIFQIN